jgi:hypothetical protein
VDSGSEEALLVPRLFRMQGRSAPGDLRAAVRRLCAGITFRSATEPLYTSTPVGRMLVQMLGVFAEFERETIIDRVINGMERKAAKGAPAVPVRPANGVLAVQQRILDALVPGVDTVECLGRLTTPGRYLTDLVQLCNLVRRSWPLGRDLVPEPALAEALEEYIWRRQDQIITDQCRRSGGDAGRQLHNEDRAPPLDSAACAALLATADRLLALDTRGH